jgi:prepilin signal peptidase PulO-like enzyme (type II secretory pathway)
VSKPLVERITFVKVVTVLAVAFGLGVGLCGLDFLLASGGIGKSHGEFGVGPLDAPSLIVMTLSACGLVVTTFLWVVFAAVRSFSRKDSEPPRLRDEKDDERKQP